MGIWLISATILAIALLVVFKAAARRSFEGDRELLDLPIIRASMAEPVSTEVFNEVWTKVGEAYSLDPRLLRPDDRLEELDAIDSWSLGKGSDSLGDWLNQKQYGLPPPLTTLLDLAKWVQARQGSSNAVV